MFAFAIKLYLPFSFINSIQLCDPFDIQALGPTESAETASYRVITCTVGRPLSPRDHITLYHYICIICVLCVLCVLYHIVLYIIGYHIILYYMIYYTMLYHIIAYYTLLYVLYTNI